MSRRRLIINVRRLTGTSTLKADIKNITPNVDKSSIDSFRGIGAIPPPDVADPNCAFIYDKDYMGIYTFANIMDGSGPKLVDLGDNAGKTKHNICDQLNTIYEMKDIESDLLMVLNPDGVNVSDLTDFL